MADRTTKVTLTAQVSGYLSGLDQAARKTQQFAQGSKQQLDKQAESFQKVGQAALAMGSLAAAGVALAVKTFADFDAKMSQVQALSHATGADMLALRDAAMTAGQGIGFSASEVADAETELVKAGVSVKDILGGALPGALQLAAAGQIDVGQATEIATIALTQFNLQGKDVPHVADLLAAGADKALGGVADLGEALKSGGLVASQFGVSLDETVGTLSAFANAGLLGETAGTDLRQMLLKLANPSADASKTMKALGINIYGANGQFVGMSDLAGQLQSKMGNLSEAQRNAALATIFGSRAIAGANVLYKDGAKGISDWTNKVNDTGFAQQQAAAKMNNLEGDAKKLGAAFENDLIKSGSGANGVLRGIVQTATTLTKAIGGLPQPVLTVGLGVTALVAGVGLLGGGFLVLVPRIAATRAAMTELGITGKSMLSTFGKSGGVMLLLTSLASAFTSTASSSELSADKLSDVNSVMKDLSKSKLNNLFKDAGTSIIDTTAKTDKFKESVNAVATGNFWQNESGIAKFVDGATLGLTHLSDVYKDNEARLRSMGQTLGEVAKQDYPTATTQFKKMVDAMGGGKEAIRQLLTKMPDYKAALTDLASQHGKTLTQQELFNVAVGKGALAQQLSVGTTKDNTAALATLSGQAVDTDGTISSLADTISNFGKGALDVSGATRDFQQAIDDAAAAVKANGRTLDDNTDKGRQNGAALDDIAKKALALASAQATAGDSTATVTKTMQAGRTAFINAAVAAGATKTAAKKLADEYGLIPSNVSTAVKVTGADDAKKKADALKRSLDALPVQKQIDVFYKTYSSGKPPVGSLLRTDQGPNQANGSILDFYANGGVREQHVAQIAPAGSWRVWAEDETGGEAYIPLAPSKRERSLSIWQATGKRLGVQGFAEGGITYVQAPAQFMHAPAAATAGTQVSISMPITAPPNVDPVVIGHVAANSLNGLLRSLP